MADRSAEIAIEVVGASVANKATVAGAVTGTFGWLAQINWIGLTGVIVAVLGLIISFYFQHRRDRREEAESAARLEAIRGRCDT